MKQSTHHDLPAKIIQTPITLTIAGSDSGGGAGIQADIKAISATGGYACSVITALTAQNTLDVTGIFPVSPAFVEQQLDAVFSDLKIQSVKIGMLSDASIIRVVAQKLRQYQPKFIVLDPVMVATSGDLLLEADAIATLKSELLPLATLITPNLPEAVALTRNSSHSENDSRICSKEKEEGEESKSALIEQLKQLNTEAILLKGGHWEQEAQSTDYLIQKSDTVTLSAGRLHTKNTHGTGCTLSAAIASYLAQGYTLTEAVSKGKSYLTQALRHADQLQIGQGHGPVHHFYARQQS
ncbi:bifunctional hydroxymethylpyrimidine kinase/phosphomethylpyrimidine kinase [Photobacterium galatheae]|uniref:bifunctional hydroxymethylpyrimidine kinase/phosphomethylpyrimidine kinase n=1 Tax=Photobacterium galatheae TaxID=1654360 RepID=UPI00202CC814|nr:bifunctional hydroxymethylpyrimidine kinase/phosphomethylpyrimidine kinase [Photobacterium galatheae]MCM0148878.1 bifunctional hydroxymethylpyrimidine kinase/phosphomethylpyrimidine kinase [Photobacterium galatheae]